MFNRRIKHEFNLHNGFNKRLKVQVVEQINSN